MCKLNVIPLDCTYRGGTILRTGVAVVCIFKCPYRHHVRGVSHSAYKIARTHSRNASNPPDRVLRNCRNGAQVKLIRNKYKAQCTFKFDQSVRGSSETFEIWTFLLQQQVLRQKLFRCGRYKNALRHSTAA